MKQKSHRRLKSELRKKLLPEVDLGTLVDDIREFLDTYTGKKSRNSNIANNLAACLTQRYFVSNRTAGQLCRLIERKKTRFLAGNFALQGYGGGHKQLALIFGFDVLSSSFPGRVLVYSDAGLLQDQQLAYGDNQFLLEIESLDLPFWLYFIHAGGYWFFTGLSGYVV